jgi:hypothetical protein
MFLPSFTISSRSFSLSRSLLVPCLLPCFAMDGDGDSNQQTRCPCIAHPGDGSSPLPAKCPHRARKSFLPPPLVDTHPPPQVLVRVPPSFVNTHPPLWGMAGASPPRAMQPPPQATQPPHWGLAGAPPPSHAMHLRPRDLVGVPSRWTTQPPSRVTRLVWGW